MQEKLKILAQLIWEKEYILIDIKTYMKGIKQNIIYADLCPLGKM